MATRRLYPFIGFVSGLILINYGFNIIAGGMQGTRQLTSQFLGLNLLVGGAAVIFASLYFLLRPIPMAKPATPQPSGSPPDVGVELIVEDVPPSQYSFYRNIEYLGYFFTAIGLFSAADLLLQVLIRSYYNEMRWWTEVLLVVFGVLAYTIFGSVGRIGSQEEKKYASAQHAPPAPISPNIATTKALPTAQPSLPEALDVRLSEFSRLTPGEYERRLSGTIYDMLRVQRDMVTIWRENRLAMRANYLAGPYELSKELLEDHANRGEALKIGYLSLSLETIRNLLSLQENPVQAS